VSQLLDAAGPVPAGPAADPVFGGIDVAKAELVWAAWSAAAGRIAGGVVANTPAGIADLGAQLTALGPVRIVCEATGGLERAVVAGLTAAALPIRVVNPRRVRALAGALAPHAKTDPIDALLLARYAHVAAPPARPAPDPRTADLKALFTRRRQVVAARVAETNQRGSALPVVAASHDAVIAVLTAELARLETEIAARITADPAMAAKATILRSVPGIGPGATLALLAGLPELGTLTGKQAARLLGVAPATNASGASAKPAHIAGGRTDVRTTLYMAMLACTRHNPVIRAFYQRLRAAHKPPKVALIACLRKLITILNAMLRDGTMWADSTAMA
jgi:transposase